MAREAKGSGGRALVIGAGVAGVAAARCLADAGVDVHLVEKKDAIGGHARGMGCKAADTCLRCNVCVADEFFRSVEGDPRIHVHTSTQLQELTAGTAHRFEAVLSHERARLVRDRSSTVDADVVIVATGYEPFDPAENSSFGYGRLPNVITGIEAEQQLAQQDRLTRPTDGRPPERLAFIQCVGSRTEEIYRRPEDTDYCSTVCCSYALRIARKIKHEAADSTVTVFYMDIQKFGKGFDGFYNDCKDTMRFVRSRPYELAAADGAAVRVTYASDDTGVCEEEFDLVILSVGIRPPADAADLADKLGVPLDEQGFFGLKGAGGLPDLQKEGIFVAGACESPKDIAGSIVQAEAVSAMVLARLGSSTPTKAKGKSRDVVVTGAGVAGMQAATTLARLGHRVALVHRGKDPGGMAAAMPEFYGYLAEDADGSRVAVARKVAALMDDVKQQKNIAIRPNASLTSVEGAPGDFRVTVSANGKADSLQAGAVVFATGSTSGPVPPARKSMRIVDMRGLLQRMRAGDTGKSVAIVLDSAGQQGRGVWAQVLSAAERLAARRGVSITIYCHHVRVAATGFERLYRRARQAGVRVTKSDKPPRICTCGKSVSVTATDPIADAEVSETFDLVVMADLQAGNGNGAGVVENLKLGPDGELQVDNIWLLPGLTNRPGVFVAGDARGNSDYRGAMTDGVAVAGEVHALLAGDAIKPRDDVAAVAADKCVLCLTCVRVCPHGAITVDGEKQTASPSPVSCRRCGICASVCPARAITLPGFAHDDLLSAVGRKPHTTVFACENSAIPAAEAAGHKFGKSVRFITVPCAGGIEPQTILKALEAGAGQVLVLGCHPESCQYLSGSSRAAKRTARLADMLEKAGFDGSRVMFGGMSSVQPGRLVEYVQPRT